MRRFLISAVVAITLAGCGGGSAAQQAAEDPGPTSSPTQLEPDPYAALLTASRTAATTTAPALADGFERAGKVAGSSVTPAATTLTSLRASLQDHAYLVALAAHAGVHEGFGSAPFRAASAALETNASSLASTVGGPISQQDPTKQEAFLQAWRSLTVAHVEHARGETTDARAEIDERIAELGSLLEQGTSDALTADALEASLRADVDALHAAIDAVSAADPAVWERVDAAAQRTAATARLLAGGLTEFQASDGDIDAPATVLVADLAAALGRDVWQVGIAGITARRATSQPTLHDAAVARFPDSAAEIAAIVERSTASAGDAIAGAWQHRSEALVDLTDAVGVGGDGADDRARLEAIRQELADLLSLATAGELDAKTASKTLQGQDSAQETAADAIGTSFAH